jgi:V8-like Glu-specific endopeptidase
MKSKTRWVLVPLLLLLVAMSLLASDARSVSATLYCNRPYSEVTVNPGKPYNAVGLLNNGCTAFLIDANHIAAAAHCFVNTTTGEWQTGLRFYPNFHPDRVTADEKHVPRADVTRVVVASRAGEGVLGAGMDWGIAKVDNWQDTAGLDLTPVALAPSVPVAGTALTNPAYTRSHFPYNDNDSITWDNMEFDTQYCGWVGESSPHKNDGGVWAIRMRTAPIYDGLRRESVWCNARWGAGYIHANCSLKAVSNDVIVHNCDTVGGSSGTAGDRRSSTLRTKMPGSRRAARPTRLPAVTTSGPAWIAFAMRPGSRRTSPCIGVQTIPQLQPSTRSTVI